MSNITVKGIAKSQNNFFAHNVKRHKFEQLEQAETAKESGKIESDSTIETESKPDNKQAVVEFKLLPYSWLSLI